MKRALIISVALLLGGCISRQPLMTSDCFNQVEVGSSINDVKKTCGKPYLVHSRGGNTDVYEYIERIYMGHEIVQQRNYFLVVTGGVVVGKYANFFNPPAYEEIYTDEPYPNY